MTEHYDAVVIGMGPGGMSASGMCATMGLKVLGIDTRKSIGGECLNEGCIPSKAYLRYGKRHFAALKGAQDEKSLPAPEVSAETQSNLKYIIDKKFGKMMSGVELALETRASFVSKKTVRLHSIHDSDDSSDRIVSFKRAYVCAGTRPFIPRITDWETLPKDRVLTNQNVFLVEPSQVDSLTIIGGSAIAVEMAQAFAHLGTKVTIVQRSAVLCRSAGTEAGELIEQELTKIPGLEVIHCDPMDKVSFEDDKVQLHLGSGRVVASHSILVAAGREPCYESLNLEGAGVRTNPKGYIVVDKYLRTKNKKIFGVGDCNGFALFSHAAMHQGMIAVMNSMIPIGKVNYKKFAVPSTIFTSPPISQVGLTPETMGRKKYVTLRSNYADYGAAIAEKVDTGFIELYLKPGMMGRILGARIIGEGSGEMINEIGALIYKKGTMIDIMMTQHSFPTQSFQLWQASNKHMMGYMATHPKMRAMAKFMF